MGVAITLGLIFVYSMGNVGVFRFYRAERPDEFNVLLHVVFPLLSTIALLWVGYKSIVPLPDPPVSYAPFIVVVWLVAGIILVSLLSRTGREEWLRKAGAVMEEESGTEGHGA
jgi:amino acid transporter